MMTPMITTPDKINLKLDQGRAMNEVVAMESPTQQTIYHHEARTFLISYNYLARRFNGDQNTKKSWIRCRIVWITRGWRQPQRWWIMKLMVHWCLMGCRWRIGIKTGRMKILTHLPASKNSQIWMLMNCVNGCLAWWVSRIITRKSRLAGVW